MSAGRFLGGKLPPWALLAVIFVSGIILMVLGDWVHSFEGGWGKASSGIIHEVGIAFTSAAILGFTVDYWFKAELAKDIFKAVCESHEMKIDISKINDDFVKVGTKTERRLKNITNHSCSLPVRVDLDEWGVPGQKSEILRLEARRGTEILFQEPELSENLNSSTISRVARDVNVPSGDAVVVVSEIVEFKRINDDAIFFFSHPTKNPTVEIVVSEGMEYLWGFGGLDERIASSGISPRRTLQGNYFPNQQMRVRWWTPEKPLV